MMTPRVGRVAFYADAGAVWIGVQVLPNWIMVQPFPCIGLTWKRS